MPENLDNASSPEQSSGGESQSDEVMSEEDDDVNQETRSTSAFPSDAYGQQHLNIQLVGSAQPPRNDEILSQPPQLELVGHSIACASTPYFDPYYGGMMTAYGQPLVHPYFLDTGHARMPLPPEASQEPVFVNVKQYHAIMRRRQSRAKAELEKKLIKDRKPYLHESRHQHALRRVRGTGGRFVKKSELDSSKHSANPKEKQTASGSSVPSSSSESLRSQQETSRPQLRTSHNTHNYVNGGQYGGQNNHFQLSSNQLGSVERKERNSSGQQWITFPSNQSSQMAVAMK